MVKSVENKPVEVSKSQIAATAKKAMLRIVFGCFSWGFYTDYG